MSKLRTLLVLCVFITMCYCESEIARAKHKKKKHHHHHHDLFYKGGLFWYFTFMALKVKTVFVIGTVFAIGLAVGKVFALLKFAEYMKKKDHHHEEKIVYGDHSYGFPSHGYSDSYPPQDLSISETASYPYKTLSSGYNPNQAPDGATYPGGPSAPPSGLNGASYTSNRNGYGRDYREHSAGGFYEKIAQFRQIIHNLNITEMALEHIHITTDDCKRKFICGADFYSKHSVILKTGLQILSDPSYENYRPSKTVTSLEECSTMYPACHDENNKTD